MYDIYSNSNDDLWRFTLGKSGTRKIFTIGLNPSTATREKSDTTVAKVEGTAQRNNFDGFVMLNLYPIRSTDYNALPVDVDLEAFSENINRIETLIAAEESPVVWAAWGESVLARDYFVESTKELINKLQKHGVSWLHFGSLTNSGHPRHPSRLSYSWSFEEFDTSQYLRILGT